MKSSADPDDAEEVQTRTGSGGSRWRDSVLEKLETPDQVQLGGLTWK